MSDVRNNAVFANMDVEPVGVEVPSHHHARLDDACRLRKLGFAKRLPKSGGLPHQQSAGKRGQTYRLSGGPVAERLAGQLVHPLLRLVAAAQVIDRHSGNNERHLACVLKRVGGICDVSLKSSHEPRFS